MKINISASSELMKNNKQADVMSPQKEFQVLQTKEGHSLFFSIGTDDVFYLTREVPGSATGWVKTDLSSVLSKYNNGVKVIAKTFKVVQNIVTNNIDIVLAIKGQNQDYVYTALNLLNEDATWANELTWLVQGYDDTANPVSKLAISDLYITKSQNTEYIVVDILKDPGSVNKFIDRYYLDPSKKVTGKVWNEHDLSANLNAGNIQSCLGKKSDQMVDGIYTLGQINSKKELIYTPLYNAFNPSLPANPSRLAIPQGASAMAAVKNNAEGTALFVAGDKALYYFAFNKQEDGDSGQLILSNDFFLNITELHANSTNTEVVVWGLNQQGQIFYTKCQLGNESNPASWSAPVPILTSVTQVATYLNNATSNNVIFAHTNGTDLIKLTQDPVTSMWSQRNIVLPSTNINDVLEFNTYTTHIQVESEDFLPKAGETVQLTSTSPVSVYVNNKFAILSPSVPLSVVTDETGTLTILQETLAVGAVCYNLQLKGDANLVNVNPMVKMMSIMENIKSGNDLSNVSVTNSDGTKQPLVSSKVSSNDKEATAQAIQQFVSASKTVPQNGNLQSKSNNQKPVLKTYKASNFVAQHDTIWGLSYENNAISFHSGEQAMSKFGLQLNTATNKFAINTLTLQRDDIGQALVVAAGDVFNWLKHVWDDVKNFFIKVIDGVYNFFITIGNELYTFILDCYHTIVSAVEFVFTKILVFLEDLIKWIGFLFKWKDILRTHDVMKNVILRYLENSITQIDSFKTGVDEAFKDVEKRINEWAGLSTLAGNLSQRSASTGPLAGKNDPQSNYGSYHLNNGAHEASTNAGIVKAIGGDLEKLLETLGNAIVKEGNIFENAYNTFKTQVIDQITTLDIGEIIKRTLGILADILVESVNNIVDTALDVVKILIHGVIDMLSGSLNIPVLSWLYKEITGNELSILDAVCLVVAIPTTLVYKIMFEEAPFPDNGTSKSLISAPTWGDLQNVFKAPVKRQLAYSTVAVQGNMVLAQAAPKEEEKELSDAEKFVIAMRVCACVSSFVFIGMSIAKKGAPTSKAISIIHGLTFFTTTAPNVAGSLVSKSDQRWDVVLGEVVYGITAIQKLADIGSFSALPVDPNNPNAPKNNWNTYGEASKWIDMVLGICGFVPTIASVAYTQTTLSITGAISNALWNANRICTPFGKNPYVFAGKMVLIGGYGVAQGVMAVEMGVE